MSDLSVTWQFDEGNCAPSVLCQQLIRIALSYFTAFLLVSLFVLMSLKGKEEKLYCGWVI
jgi:hypothetical protein